MAKYRTNGQCPLVPVQSGDVEYRSSGAVIGQSLVVPKVTVRIPGLFTFGVASFSRTRKTFASLFCFFFIGISGWQIVEKVVKRGNVRT